MNQCYDKQYNFNVTLTCAHTHTHGPQVTTVSTYNIEFMTLTSIKTLKKKWRHACFGLCR